MHTPKNVEYTVEGFREKNMDSFSSLVHICLINSRGKFTRLINTPVKEERAKPKTLASKFRGDMSNLIEYLNNTDCHFVRCIKSNEGKKGKTYNEHMVLQ